MKAVLLAGGFGTRLGELTHEIPKPMVTIGSRPILWHIMKLYHSHGISDFIICCGYKGYIIKEYFANYMLHMSDVTFDYSKDTVQYHKRGAEDWTVTLVNTGEKAMTGGRLLAVQSFLRSDDYFCLTYGDGVSDVNISDVIEFHKNSGLKATMTIAAPPGRFGAVQLDENKVKSFKEKPSGDGSYVNAGFFVFNNSIFQYIHDDKTVLEEGPLQALSSEGELAAFIHNGYWQPMDTLRDKRKLEKDWISKAPWRNW